MRSRLGGPPKQGRWCLPAEAIALMRAVMVVVSHERVQGALQRPPAGEVAAAEGHPPVFLEDRPLQPLHEAVGPGMPGLGPRVPDPELATGLIEGPLELRAAVGEHALDRPAGPAVVWHLDREAGVARLALA